VDSPSRQIALAYAGSITATQVTREGEPETTTGVRTFADSSDLTVCTCTCRTTGKKGGKVQQIAQDGVDRPLDTS